MKTTNRDLLSLAERLEAGEDPKSIAAELRPMARGSWQAEGAATRARLAEAQEPGGG